MQDAVAAFQVAPLWAQIGMVLFATMVVVALVEPSVRQRRFRRRFDAIAQGLGQQVRPSRELPTGFDVNVGDRTFAVTHDLRSTSRRGSYRGPAGYLLITATKLAGNRWSMHQVDVSKAGRIALRLKSGRHLTGDADFDARFLVMEEGLPVRNGWLNAPTHQAFARFLDEAPAPGVLWIREGELQFIMPEPWPRADGPTVRALLERQSALALALDRTAAGQLRP